MGCVEGCVMGKAGRMTRARRILLIVGMTALCAGVAPASIFRRGGDKKPAPATPAVAPAALSLTAVEVEPSPSPRLVLRTSGAPVYSSYSPAPDQFVVEFTGTSKGSALAVPSPLPVAVQSVSVDETTDMGAMLTRVTVRLTQALTPQISVVENAVVVTLPEEAPKPVVAEEVPAVAPIVEPAIAETTTIPEPTVQSEPVAAETHIAAAPAALAPVPSNKAKTLKKVETSGSGNALEVQLAGDGDINYKSFRLVNPARVVIDLAGVRNAVAQKTLNVTDSMVRRVRVGQFKDAPDPITRVVLEIDEKATYRIDKDGSRLRITFGGSAAPAMAASNTIVPETKTTIVEQPPMMPAARPVEVVASAPAKQTDITTQVPVVAENATWKMPPAASKGATPVINAPAPQTPPKAPRPTKAATPAAASTPAPAEDVFNDAAQAPAVQPSQSGAVLGGTLGGSRQLSAGEHVYTGEPISLNLKDADIKDVLRTFAQLTGLNMAIDPGVAGSVTVDFVEVPWDQALDIILRQNGLRFVLDGNVMRIGTIDRITGEEKALQLFLQQQSENVPLQTVSFKLSYARAADVQTLLKEMASTRARIIVDARTNQLIISEIPQYLQTMRNLIDAVDVPTRQVVIEARIVETSKLFTQQYGFITGFHGTLDPSLGTGTGLVFPNKVDVIGGPFDFGGGGNPLIQLSLGNVLGTFTLDLALTASEFEGLTRIISAPRVTTQDNVSAEIQSGFQIPYQTRVNFTTTVTYIDATLRLSVLPQITEAGTIIMDIQVQKNEPNTSLAIAGAVGVPISTRQAKTRLMVRDGGTSVIAGIYQTKDGTGQTRIPFLHQIPILGNLFKTHEINTTHDELLIFITPRIVRSS
jgi:type IV pilus secretin PilQ/predicted competence protein